MWAYGDALARLPAAAYFCSATGSAAGLHLLRQVLTRPPPPPPSPVRHTPAKQSQMASEGAYQRAEETHGAGR